MKIYIEKNKEIINEKVSKIIIDLIKSKKDAILGLATGSSPIGIYKKLVEDHLKNKTDYSNVTSVNLDEYINLDKVHPESYYSFMHHHLFSKININEKNVNLPNGIGKDHLKSCEEYEKILINNIPDIQLLGIGSNGHIGFNEPGVRFDSLTQIVDLKESTRLDNARFFNNNLEEVPKQAITMGIKSIMRAKQIILVAFGEAKAKAIYDMIKGDISENCPASILQKHPNVLVFVDEAAAELL